MYRPATPVELYIITHPTPTTPDLLAPIERAHLERIFQGDDLARILREGTRDGDEFPLDLELAAVVDERGRVRYRLYAMSLGVVYLMDAYRVACVSFASQHEHEHWRADQRELFWAMDHALRRGDHGVRQPMQFNWWDDARWAGVVDARRRRLHSEPDIRRQFADEGERAEAGADGRV